MKYKISETPLKLREYGRNIQSMVEYLKTLEDKDKRTKLAHEVVSIMSNLQPQLKEFPDYKQKLWDHLFIIGDFELDIESPFPLPEREVLLGRPERRMDYYTDTSRYRQYGKNIDLMIKEATKMEEGPDKVAFINIIANTMKLFLRNIDRDSTPESVIAEHIVEISGGKLSVKGEDLTISKYIPPKQHHSRNNGHHHGGKRDNGKRGGRKGGRKKKN